MINFVGSRSFFALWLFLLYNLGQVTQASDYYTGIMDTTQQLLWEFGNKTLKLKLKKIYILYTKTPKKEEKKKKKKLIFWPFFCTSSPNLILLWSDIYWPMWGLHVGVSLHFNSWYSVEYQLWLPGGHCGSS